jgi:hypothetical protein
MERKTVVSRQPLAPLEGYRLLKEGETIRTDDLFTRNGNYWLPCKKKGGRWNEKTCWPMARKMEE